MTPFDYLGALLDWCYARSKILGVTVAVLIAIACAIGLALIPMADETVRGVWGA